MNIEKGYKEKMLDILNRWKKNGQITSSTVGYAVKSLETGEAFGQSRYGFGGCGGFMSTMYSYGQGTRNLWPVPSNLKEEEFVALFKLWLQMLGELYIPIKFIGVEDRKDIKGIDSKLNSYIDQMGSGAGTKYKRVIITEIKRSDYVSSSHFKCAHTGLRYLFRAEMMDAAFHTIQMKLNNPAISVHDCLVTASYFCYNYNSSMMLFRWRRDNGGKIYPVPRSRGEIVKQLMSVRKEGNSNSSTGRITYLYTKTFRTSKKTTKSDRSLLTILDNCRHYSEKEGPNYLEALKALRHLAKLAVNEAVTA